jgi:DNA-binding NtrC family response regulator
MLAIAPRTRLSNCVLVVEDEILVRIGLADALREGGFTVIEASNAREALAVLDARTEVALVFSDIRMPGDVDGVGLARIIGDRFGHVKVVLTSAVAPKDYRGPFIPKPYDLDQLVVSLTQALQ